MNRADVGAGPADVRILRVGIDEVARGPLNAEIEVSLLEVSTVLTASARDSGVMADLRVEIDAATLARVDRLHREIDRDRTVLAHAALRRRLAVLLGMPPAEIPIVRTCVVCGREGHGAPRLDVGRFAAPSPPVSIAVPAPLPSPARVPPPRRAAEPVATVPVPQFSISHSGDRIAVAISWAAVGVDIETVRPAEAWTDVRQLAFRDRDWVGASGSADPSRELTGTWTRGEAALKAWGVGLAMPMTAVGWTREANRDTARSLSPHGDGSAPIEPWRLDLENVDAHEVPGGARPFVVPLRGWTVDLGDSVLSVATARETCVAS